MHDFCVLGPDDVISSTFAIRRRQPYSVLVLHILSGTVYWSTIVLPDYVEMFFSVTVWVTVPGSIGKVRVDFPTITTAYLDIPPW